MKRRAFFSMALLPFGFTLAAPAAPSIVHPTYWRAGHKGRIVGMGAIMSDGSARTASFDRGPVEYSPMTSAERVWLENSVRYGTQWKSEPQ